MAGIAAGLAVIESDAGTLMEEERRTTGGLAADALPAEVEPDWLRVCGSREEEAGLEVEVVDLLPSICFLLLLTLLSPSATLLALPLWTNRLRNDIVEVRLRVRRVLEGEEEVVDYRHRVTDRVNVCVKGRRATR